MKFIDEAKILAKAGNGGNGIIAWRQEKSAPYGGPSGGNGGNGGNIVFIANSNIHSLLDFRFNSRLIAENGKNGRNKNRAGANGKDKIIKVPIGTQIFNNDTGKILVDMIDNNVAVSVCKGGNGGKGNANFATSTRQAPDFAKSGLIGEEYNLRLSLKLMADVGLIGFPNSGKSTLLSSISLAKPKISNYHFTTLTPNLGVVLVNDMKSMIVADIPGLIKGSSNGLGLGFRFLKHLERVRVLCHLVEFKQEECSFSNDTLISRYNSIIKELLNFSPKLINLPEVVVISKIDLLGNNYNIDVEKFERYIFKSKKKLIKISSINTNGISELIQELSNTVFNDKD